MARFTTIETPQGTLSLGMRIGLHTGRFLTAHIGTPKRMEHVLLGSAVQRSKRAEGAGTVGRVCVTEAIATELAGQFRFEEGAPGYMLVADDFSEEELGEYEIVAPRSRKGHTILFDRSVPGLIHEIGETLKKVEPLASYLPSSILTLLVESASRREIQPEFVNLVAMFVNILGLSERIEELPPEEQANVVVYFSRLFARINAAVLEQGGVLKNVTYHLVGSDMLIYFGVPNGHVDDAARAAEASLAIREIVRTLPPPIVNGAPVPIACQIGVAWGFAFAAEIGEPRGRREFNVLGDSVNIAARLMSRAEEDQILVSWEIAKKLKHNFICEPLGLMALKGKSAALHVFSLEGRKA
jgi:adenylate cyclase